MNLNCAECSFSQNKLWFNFHEIKLINFTSIKYVSHYCTQAGLLRFFFPCKYYFQQKLNCNIKPTRCDSKKKKNDTQQTAILPFLVECIYFTPHRMSTPSKSGKWNDLYDEENPRQMEEIHVNNSYHEMLHKECNVRYIPYNFFIYCLSLLNHPCVCVCCKII